MDKPVTRKEALASLIILPALAAGLMVANTATADAKGTKAAFKYQDKPNDGKACATCSLFIPGKSKTANGQCKAVAGSISPHGWCVAYNKK